MFSLKISCVSTASSLGRKSEEMVALDAADSPIRRPEGGRGGIRRDRSAANRQESDLAVMRNHADSSNSKRSVWHGHKKLLRLAAACQMDRNYRARNQRLQRLRRSSRMSHVERVIRCLSVQVTEPGPALETSGRESDKPFEGGKPMCCPSEHEVQPWLSAGMGSSTPAKPDGAEHQLTAESGSATAEAPVP